MDRLMHSSKFWTAVFDAVGSTALLLGVRFWSPADVELIVKLIALYQPIFFMVVCGTAYEDGKTAQAMAAKQA